MSLTIIIEYFFLKKIYWKLIRFDLRHVLTYVYLRTEGV
jgi:hypothetical protein